MAKKFVRGITDIKTITNQDFDTNNVNDLLSDGKNNYIHRKKQDGTEEYHNLTDNLKTVTSDNTELLEVTNNNTTNSATFHPKHDSQKEQLIEASNSTISIVRGENSTSEKTLLKVSDSLVETINNKQDKLTAGVGVAIDNNQININSNYIKHYNNIKPNKLSDLALLDMSNKANCTLTNGAISVKDSGYLFPTIQVKDNDNVHITLFNVSDPTKVTWRVKLKNGDGVTEPVQFKGYETDGVYYLDMSTIQDLIQNDDDVLQIRIDNRRVNQNDPINDTLTIEQFMISKGGIPTYNSNDFESVYVDASSLEDIENGTKQFPFKTIQRAINVNPKNIMIASGTYNENIMAMERPTLKMTAIPPIYNNNKPIPDKPKVVITNGTELALTTDNDNPTLLSTNQNYNNNSRLYRVFITKTMPLTETESLISVGYNVSIWEHHNNDTARLQPVIDLTTCLSTAGSFTYDGKKLYVNPSLSNNSKFIFTDAKTYKQNERLADFRNIGELILEGIDFKYSYDTSVYIKECNRVAIKDCEASYSSLSNGFATLDTNTEFVNCKGNYNRGDGFNHHGYGNVLVNQCFGFNNYDDGCSHHDGTTGTIVGGEYAFNGKGGIAPTYGSDIYVKDVYSHNNKYGCYMVSRPTDKLRDVIHKDNVFINNSTYDYLIADNYTIKGIDNRYSTIDGSSKYVTI